ncbi:MurR/RpiR family transcriptional regulator [Aliagarivorans taiwanensis]|uniref:MurR/RpiR family transcriptional regulator n=1 Tax=Aliagarivorans taiwanensis TaxID=561966 RepID=UPI000422262B|nr:LacI family DNA-binding transcriptional regulator [Aliagarivorans taiwanensis]
MKSNLQARIRVIEEQLSRRERALAEAMLRLGPLLRNYSAGELASLAGVSVSTVSRFIKRLGYQHFKHALKESGDINVSNQQQEARLTARYAAGNLKKHTQLHLSSEQENIQHTYERLDQDLLNTIVQQLVAANKLWVVGFDDDYAMAHYARSLLIRVKSDIRMIPLSGFPVAEEFASISESDVIMVFAQRRLSPDDLKIIASGQAVGAHIVLISGETVQSLPGVSMLRYRSRGMYMFDSGTAGISLINHLCAEVGGVLGEPAIKRLYFIESLHDEWNG